MIEAETKGFVSIHYEHCARGYHICSTYVCTTLEACEGLYVALCPNQKKWICITALNSFMVKVSVLCCGLQLNVVYVVMHKVHILALSLIIGCIRGLINSVE